MTVTKANANLIVDELNMAMSAIFTAQQNLRRAVQAIDNDHPTADDSSNVEDVIGALSIARKALYATEIRWNGYASARGK